MRPINTSSLILVSGVLVPGYFCGNDDDPEAPSVEQTTTAHWLGTMLVSERSATYL